MARHARSYGREEMIFNPLHHLALLKRKSNAGRIEAAPLQGWRLPEEFNELRQQMEALGKRGRR